MRQRAWPGPALLGIGFLALGLLARPPHTLWPLALVALAPLAWLAETRRPLRTLALAWLGWTALGLAVFRDLLYALSVEYRVPVLAASLFAAIVVGAHATVPAFASAAYAALRRRARPWAAPLLFASLLIASEWLRAEPLALPWLLAGDALARTPALIQHAELGGLHAVGLVPALVSGGVGAALARRRRTPLAIPLLTLVLAAGYGTLHRSLTVATASGIEVGIVQGSVPQRERFRPGSAVRNTLRHAELTRRLVAEAAPALVVWSETAVDEDLDAAPGLRVALERLVTETGVPLLTGAPRSEHGLAVNAAVLLRPGQPPASYSKQRLVPFAERDPAFVGVLSPLVAPLVEGEGYVAGEEATLLPFGAAAIAAPICFEITYPDLMRRFRTRGAELIVNLTNDAWFGRGPYAGMHFHHAIFRAVELRSWVVRGANTGISGVIDPWGHVVAELPLFEAGVLRARVHPTRRLTPYARHGDAPLLALLAGLAVLALASGSGIAHRPRS